MKKESTFRVILLSILNLILANPSISENIRLLTLIFTLLITFKSDYLLIYLLGTCNSIPFIKSISPLMVIMTVIILKIVHYMYNKKIKIKDIFLCTEIKLLYILLIWLFICGLINDFMVFKPYLLGLLTTTSIVILTKVNKLINVKTARYFMYGIFQNLIVGYLSNFNLIGFNDYGLNRLTLARGDANSNALIYGIIVIFSIVTIVLKFKSCNFKFIDVVYIIIALLGGHLLLTTASRGAFISVIVSLVVFIVLNFININKKIIVDRRKRILYLAYKFFIISIIIITMYFMIDEIYLYILDKYNVLFLRLFENKSGLLEGDIRSSLYTLAIKKSINSPIIGFGMKNFMNVINLYPHNTYLDYLTAGGIIGIFLYIIVVTNITIKSIHVNCYKFDHTIFAIIMCNIYLMINTATYSAIGDKILWIVYAILIIHIGNNLKIEKDI